MRTLRLWRRRLRWKIDELRFGNVTKASTEKGKIQREDENILDQSTIPEIEMMRKTANSVLLRSNKRKIQVLQTNSHLLQLPGELRNEIYEAFFSTLDLLPTVFKDPLSDEPGILFTCKQLRAEMLPYYCECLRTAIRKLSSRVRKTKREAEEEARSQERLASILASQGAITGSRDNLYSAWLEGAPCELYEATMREQLKRRKWRVMREIEEGVGDEEG